MNVRSGTPRTRQCRQPISLDALLLGGEAKELFMFLGREGLIPRQSISSA